MSLCTISAAVTGRPAVDGAGVRMVRVLGPETIEAFDPFLMLDSFDSADPADYVAGFPLHPHRGIETITYLASGRIDHRDSLGNAGSIQNGQAQWMCAGSGIMHEEMPQPSDRMLGVQVWLNLPASQKMAHPAYHALDRIPEVRLGDGVVARVVAGSLGGVQGFAGDHLPAEFYELVVPAGAAVEVPVVSGQAPRAFLLEGDAMVNGSPVPAKTALAFAEDGDAVRIEAPADRSDPARVLYFSAPRLNEPVAWGGPVVMSTEAELDQAFRELRAGTFVRERPEL